MFKPAFSSVACPEWTLDRLLAQAATWGFEQVELRTGGYESRGFASDPALTSAAKVRRLVRESGVELACVSTGLRFDRRIWPPVMGWVFGDREREVRLAKDAIDLASSIECPLVRVFAFDFGGERRGPATRRIGERLAMVGDHARNTGVRVAVENGGSFRTASELASLLDAADHPLVGAAYSMGVAIDAGEDPATGVNVLGERLWLARVRDARAGRECPLGEGEFDSRAFVEALARSAYAGAVVVDWNRAWVPGLSEPENALPRSLERLLAWSGAASPA